MSQKLYLTSQEAAAQLGVSVTTLYAYVSRGLIRSEATAGKRRQRHYLAEDVQKLVDRKAQRRDPARAAQDALHWGTPVLESALTLIDDGRLYYRGQDACRLAQQDAFEDVAALLWTNQRERAVSLFATPVVFDDVFIPHGSPITTMQMALALAAERDFSAYNLAPDNVAQTGARILQRLTLALTRSSTLTTTIAATLSEAWRVTPTRLVDAALILCADHELNVSSFAARVIASADTTPYAVVMGGLAALTGGRHGGQTRRVAAFLREIEQAESIRATVGARLQRGDEIPGFGHRLYSAGDPRGALLLSLLEQTAVNGVNAASVTFSRNVSEEVRQMTGKAPTIDFALVTLERALRLPPDSALALFGLGRTAGWIAHAIEQYATGQLIRPRAKYTGGPPS